MTFWNFIQFILAVGIMFVVIRELQKYFDKRKRKPITYWLKKEFSSRLRDEQIQRELEAEKKREEEEKKFQEWCEFANPKLTKDNINKIFKFSEYEGMPYKIQVNPDDITVYYKKLN